MSRVTPITDDDLLRFRGQLPATSSVAYLNAGTLGPLPVAAIDAMAEEQRYDVEQRQSADHWERLMELQSHARLALTRLTGVTSEQVALMHSTHEGLNATLWGLELRDGDNVVTTDEEHPGLLVPLRHANARTGAEIRAFAWKHDDAAFVDAACALVDERTRAIFLSHVSWQTGRIAPLRALRDALPAHVRIVVDGAQSAGVLEVDPTDGWDAYTVSGQKWPCGPNGSGGLALVDPEAWQPTYGAYAHVAHWDDYVSGDLVTDGRRFEMSQEALPPLAGFAAAVDWIAAEVGIARAHAHARYLNAHARDRLSGAQLEPGQLHGEAHLLAIDVPAGSAPDITTAMHDAGFLVRPLGEDRVRCSFGFWNTTAEVDGAMDAITSQLGLSR
jgi:L-cysteine/cystine lyase